MKQIAGKYGKQETATIQLHSTSPHLLAELEVIRGTPVARDNRSILQAQCNKLLARCASTGGWQESLYLYEVMTDLGLDTDRHTYHAMITSCKNARPSQVQVAIEVFQEMQRSGFAACTASYNLTLGACQKDGQWRRALQVFKEMCARDRDRVRSGPRRGDSTDKDGGLSCAPNTATYTIISDTCAKAKLDDIPDLYDAMKFAGVPEYIAYSTGAKATTREHPSKSLFAA
jgi:pentatricopeptide repeat domain-containing protein 1